MTSDKEESSNKEKSSNKGKSSYDRTNVGESTGMKESNVIQLFRTIEMSGGKEKKLSGGNKKTTRVKTIVNIN